MHLESDSQPCPLAIRNSKADGVCPTLWAEKTNNKTAKLVKLNNRPEGQ